VSDLLIDEFGSLAATLAAPASRLDRLLAFHPDVSLHLGRVRAAMLHALRDEALPDMRIDGTAALARYLRAEMGWRPCEQLRILFLATGNRLLADEVMFEGSIDSAPLLPRPIVHRALDLGASGLVMIHNHPSGDCEPSSADVQATRKLMAVCNPLDIVLHDHLVVARGGWTSLRLKGLM